MVFENLIFGIVSLLVSMIIFIYEFYNDGIKQDDDSSFKYYSIKGAIIFLLLAIYLISTELAKII
jgi:uncharacterized membrane protein